MCRVLDDDERGVGRCRGSTRSGTRPPRSAPERPPRSPGDRRFDCRWVERQGIGIDVHEDRRGAVAGERVGGRDEREGRHDHLAAPPTPMSIAAMSSAAVHDGVSSTRVCPPSSSSNRPSVRAAQVPTPATDPCASASRTKSASRPVTYGRLDGRGRSALRDPPGTTPGAGEPRPLHGATIPAITAPWLGSTCCAAPRSGVSSRRAASVHPADAAAGPGGIRLGRHLGQELGA